MNPGRKEIEVTAQPEKKYRRKIKTDLKGKQFGRLRVIEFAGYTPDQRIAWRCQCACGAEKTVRAKHLTQNLVYSCGCLARERTSDLKTTHGHAKPGRVISEWYIWQGMKQRCQNPDNDAFKYYGGRGISVCHRWESFEAFLADMGRRPARKTLERIENDKGYSPENCRWATRKEQNRNKRNNRRITIRAETKILVEWAEQFGLSQDLVWNRLRLGWTIERALGIAV